jgi:hypothetical protein
MSGSVCRYVAFWCALVLVWAAGVTAVVAARIGDQVAASEDVAHDIAALDGGGAGHALVTRWQDIAALMLEYRSLLLLEVTFLPPLVLLAACLAWRRWAPSLAARPIYAAAVRRVVPSRFM